MRESGEPRKASGDAGLHRVSHVGKDACRYAGTLKGSRPVDHGLIGLRPEIDVGLEELCKFVAGGRMAQLRANDTPETHAVEHSEVVVVAMTPVGGAQFRMRNIEDGFH